MNSIMRPSFEIIFVERNTYRSRKQYTKPNKKT